jgi:hypothetical protein
LNAPKRHAGVLLHEAHEGHALQVLLAAQPQHHRVQRRRVRAAHALAAHHGVHVEWLAGGRSIGLRAERVERAQHVVPVGGVELEEEVDRAVFGGDRQVLDGERLQHEAKLSQAATARAGGEARVDANRDHAVLREERVGGFLFHQPRHRVVERPREQRPARAVRLEAEQHVGLARSGQRHQPRDVIQVEAAVGDASVGRGGRHTTRRQHDEREAQRATPHARAREQGAIHRAGRESADIRAWRPSEFRERRAPLQRTTSYGAQR